MQNALGNACTATAPSFVVRAPSTLEDFLRSIPLGSRTAIYLRPTG